MAIGTPKDITECRRFFLEPSCPRQRQYEALRAFYVEEKPSAEVAKSFGYSPGAFRVLCHGFRRDDAPDFFASVRPGPRDQPKKSAAQEVIVELRKKNYSVYDISELLKEKGIALSPTAVGEVLKEEGFAPLPRRLDEERPGRPRPNVQAVADVRSFQLKPRRFETSCGGLFLFIPDMVRLGVGGLAGKVGLPGSEMVPPEHALRACLALKLWSIERKSHVMALAADEGLALFSGLNCTPKRSFLSEYSSRVDHTKTTALLGAWHDQVAGDALFTEDSFNLDFHSVPYYGESPIVERHYVSMRSRRQPSVLAFLAQDEQGRAFCYSNADLRKGEEANEIIRFIEFWERHHGHKPRHLVFDSKLTTHANLARIDKMGITFITLRRRHQTLLKNIVLLPASAWEKVELDVPTRKFRTPRIHETSVRLAGRDFRQVFVKDLGHEEPTIILTNDRETPVPKVITRYAHRMLIENALSDAVRFFHMNALSSSVGLKVDFDMSLLVIASGLYRLLARRMRGYVDAQARQLFRDIINMPADVSITDDEVQVRLHRRAHLPIVLASGLLDDPVKVPWWNGLPLRVTA